MWLLLILFFVYTVLSLYLYRPEYLLLTSNETIILKKVDSIFLKYHNHSSIIWIIIKFKNCLHCAKSVQIRSFFWSVFSRIRTGYPYSVQMRKNTDQKNLLIWTLFTQCCFLIIAKFMWEVLIRQTLRLSWF